jgi:hypothetical protein
MMQEYSHTRETETYRHLPRLARVSASYYLRLKRKTTTTPTEGQYAGDLVSNAGKRNMGPKCERVGRSAIFPNFLERSGVSAYHVPYCIPITSYNCFIIVSSLVST